MKLLVVLFAVLALVWLLRRTLGRSRPGSSRRRARPDVQPMLACAQCGLHLPGNEALPGRGGVFCGEPHRSAFERDHPEAEP